MKRSSIEILGKTVKIVYKEMEGLHGEWQADENTIYISDKLEGQMLLDTLCHESYHSMLTYSGLDCLLSEEMNEALTRLTEYCYLNVVKDIMSKELDVDTNK